MWKHEKKEKRDEEWDKKIANFYKKGYSILEEKKDKANVLSTVATDRRKLMFIYTLSQVEYTSKVTGYLNLEGTKHEMEERIEQDILQLSAKCKREAQLKPSIKHIEGGFVECYLTNKKLITGILKANPLIKEKMIESENEIYVIPSESIDYIKIKKEI